MPCHPHFISIFELFFIYIFTLFTNHEIYMQWRSQPKNMEGAKTFGGRKCLILGEYHYFA